MHWLLLRKEFDVEGVVIEITNKINGFYEKN